MCSLVYQVENACLNDQQKSAIAERLAVAEHCLLEGSDEYLQVNFPLSEVLLVFAVSRITCNSGDGSGHFHDENASHGLKMERRGKATLHWRHSSLSWRYFVSRYLHFCFVNLSLL